MRRVQMTAVAILGLTSLVGSSLLAQARAEDQMFVAQAAMTNMAEIQIGHLATERASAPAVKALATRW